MHISFFMAVSHFTVAFFGRQYCFVVAQYYFLNTFTALQTCILFLLVLLCPLVVAAQLTSVVPNVSRNVTTLSRNITTLPRTKFKLVSKMPLIVFCAVAQMLSVVECTSSVNGGATAFKKLPPSFEPLVPAVGQHGSGVGHQSRGNPFQQLDLIDEEMVRGTCDWEKKKVMTLNEQNTNLNDQVMTLKAQLGAMRKENEELKRPLDPALSSVTTDASKNMQSPLMMVNITAAFENEKAQAIVQSSRRTTTRKRKRRIVRHFTRQPESAEEIMAMVHGRRLVDACDPSTWKFADDASLSGSDGWNVLSASCNLGSDFTVPLGKTLKIKKDPTMDGELVIDRQATQSNPGRHFMVRGTLNIEGVTLTGGYVSAIDKCN